ncbi:MAG: polysaccharide deacetylase family protein [Chitinispirillaceae bacterium]|nr:polysaccharide deacetylase family protein [Chitinispirillaceae bacterium]
MIRTLHEKGYRSVTLADAGESHGRAGPSKSIPFLLTFDDGCRSFLTCALPLLEELGWKATLFPVSDYLGKLSTWDVLPPFPHLHPEELRSIKQLGHEIGSHTATHADLTYLDTAGIKQELSDSKKTLEDITGAPVTALSFPFGSWNTLIWNIARESGYERATIYRGHSRASGHLYPVHGIYRFDTPWSVLERINPTSPFSLSQSLAVIMSHFAKGAPVWRFRRSYTVPQVRS